MLVQFIKFAGVGGIGTLVQYVILILLVETANVEPIFASTLGMVFGAVTNYYLNYYFTFRSKKQHLEAMPKFFVVATIGLLLNGAAMAVGTKLLSFQYIVVQLSATALVLIWNFAINRLWTFQERGDVCR